MPTTTISPYAAIAAGALPLQNVVVRFAIGDPEGQSSNSWRAWQHGPGDIYLACRDTMQETKVSLHVSGRWRFGFTAEAAKARPDLIAPETDRAMETWDKPSEVAPGVIHAIKLYFPSAELPLTVADRKGKKWKDVIYIEEGPPDVCTVVSIFVTTFSTPLSLAGIRSFALAIWELPDGTFAQLVAHAQPGNMTGALSAFREQGREAAVKAGVLLPEKIAYQFWGVEPSGARYTVITNDPVLPA